MRGSAPEGSCGQGVPRVNREVQARVVLDAIVSTKTFWNATFGPIYLARFLEYQRLRIGHFFRIFRKFDCSVQAGVVRSEGEPRGAADVLGLSTKWAGARPQWVHSFCFAGHKFYLDAVAGCAPVVS